MADPDRDDQLLDALSQGNDETRAALTRIYDACPGPAYRGIVLAKICNKLDPDNIHHIQEVADDIIEVLEDTGPDDEANALILELERTGDRARDMAWPSFRDGERDDE